MPATDEVEVDTLLDVEDGDVNVNTLCKGLILKATMGQAVSV